MLYLNIPVHFWRFRCRFSPCEPAPTGPPCSIIDVIEDPQHVEDDQVPVEGEGVAVSVENILCQKHLVGEKYLDLLSKAMLAITMASISRAFPWAWSNFEVTDWTFLVIERTPWVTVPGRRPLSSFFWIPLKLLKFSIVIWKA